MTNLLFSNASSARLPTLDQVRAERARREAVRAAADSERRLEEERHERLNHDVEKTRCAADAEGIIYWINNYCWTYDPRRIGKTDPVTGERLSPYVRFVLWPKQEEFIRWLHDRVEAGEEFLVEKSRDVGASYLCMAYAVNRWLFVEGFKSTFGSRKLEFVDAADQPDSLFEKARIMLRRLPAWMMPGGFDWGRHSVLKRLTNPENGASITGEGGEEMGRGGRSSLYVVDEAAFVANAENTEKALSGNTDCVGWVSSVNGMGNLFAKKRHQTLKPHQVFRLHWRDDPRKTEEWAAAKEGSFTDPTGWASEYDIDYSASVEGICIPAKWVQAAQRVAELDARLKPANETTAGLDVGAGKAKSVYSPKSGPVVLPPRSRGDPDTTGTAHWALDLSKEIGVKLLNFDAPGVGAGVSSTLALNEVEGLQVEPVNTGVPAPEDRIWPDERTSEETFGNLKAEIWWLARTDFQRTFAHVLWLEGKEGGMEHPVSEIVSLPKGDRESETLASQLSLVKWFKNEKGKIVIETKQQLTRRGISSPDYADAYVLNYVDARSRYDIGAF